MERLDDLQHNGLMLYQDTDYERFNADALWLCAFLRASKADRVVELGSGSGVICVLGADNTSARFTGVSGRRAWSNSRKGARHTTSRTFALSARMRRMRLPYWVTARLPSLR